MISYAKFLGFATGMGCGIILALILLLRMKSSKLGQDERTALVHTKAGQWSFYIMAGVVFSLWVSENVRLGAAQGEVQFFSTPGIVFWTMVVIYLANVVYHQWASSGSVLAGNTEKQRLLGFIMLANSLTLSGITRSVPAFLYVQIAMLLCGIYLLVVSRRTESAH